MTSQDPQDLSGEAYIPFPAGKAERQSLLEYWRTFQPEDHGERQTHRFSFEDALVPAAIIHPGGGRSLVEVLLSNISAGGSCMLHRGYLHPSTECTLHLRANDASIESSSGQVKWCTLVRGSYHASGISWDAPLLPRGFVDPRVWLEHSQAECPPSKETLHGRFILLTADEMQRMLIHMLLRESDASAEIFDSSGSMLDAVRAGGFDVVVVDVDNGDFDIENIPKLLIDEGYTGPVIALTHESGSATIESFRKYGYAETMLKPLRQDSFIMGVKMAIEHCANAAAGTGPIVSTLSTTDDMSRWLDEYMTLVREKAVVLEEAARADDTDVARAICDSIRNTGASYGFPLLTEIAGEALTAINAGGSAKEAMSQIRQLIRIIERLSQPSEDDEPGGQLVA